MTSFLKRGGAWVLAQSVLLGGIIALPVFFRARNFPTILVIAGAVLLLLGAGVSLAGAVALGRNLTPFPKPAAEAHLVRHGIYAKIRHPLYSSVISAALGWSLIWQSWPALTVTAFLIPLLHAKARHEERWLRKKFPEYAEYQRQVPRFLPWP